jgi:uncharacterized membrane protein
VPQQVAQGVAQGLPQGVAQGLPQGVALGVAHQVLPLSFLLQEVLKHLQKKMP